MLTYTACIFQITAWKKGQTEQCELIIPVARPHTSCLCFLNFKVHTDLPMDMKGKCRNHQASSSAEAVSCRWYKHNSFSGSCTVGHAIAQCGQALEYTPQYRTRFRATKHHSSQNFILKLSTKKNEIGRYGCRKVDLKGCRNSQFIFC